MNTRLRLYTLSLVGTLAATSALALPQKPTLVYIGCSQGIYLSRFEPNTGNLSTPELAAQAPNASFLALDKKGQYLYAVGELETFANKKTGSIRSFRIEGPSGKLLLLNEEVSNGTGPCHLALDASGRCVLVANYSSGSIAALPIQKDGSLGPPRATIQHRGSSTNPSRQTEPHAHFITADPANRFVLACDLGLDKVLVYRFDPLKLSLTENDPPSLALTPGAGPRHLVFHPNGRFVYVINEMGSSLAVCTYDSKHGVLNTVQTMSTLPPSFKGDNTCAEVQVHPSGKFLYASNRGHDSLAVFAIDHKTGKLTGIGHEPTQGRTPRHFALDPTGAWLLAENQDSNTIVVFHVNTDTGKLAATGKTIEVGSPGCVVFAPISSF